MKGRITLWARQLRGQRWTPWKVVVLLVVLGVPELVITMVVTVWALH